jgi:hypothetical protein
MPMLPNGNNPNASQQEQFGNSATSDGFRAIPKDVKLAIPEVTAAQTRTDNKIGSGHDYNPSWSPMESGDITKSIDLAEFANPVFEAKK